MRLLTIIRTTHPTARAAVLVAILGLLSLGIVSPAQGTPAPQFQDYDKLKAIFQSGWIKNTPKVGLETFTETTVRGYSGIFPDPEPFSLVEARLITGQAVCTFVLTDVRKMGTGTPVSHVGEDGCAKNAAITVAADKNSASFKPIVVPIFTGGTTCDDVTDICTVTTTFSRNLTVAAAWQAAPEISGGVFTSSDCVKGLAGLRTFRSEVRDVPAVAVATVNGTTAGPSVRDAEST